MNELYRESMKAAVDRLYAEQVPGRSVTGVVIASAKKTFFAGGNLTADAQADPDDAARDLRLRRGRSRPALRRLELFPRPVVAAINGAALGGGFEIALAANHRIAVDDPSVQIGLPEVDPRPAARRRRRHPRRPDARHPAALMDVLLPGHRASSRPRPRRRAWSTSSSPPATSWCRPPRRGSSPTATTPTRRRTRGTATATRCPAAPRATPKLAAFLPAFPALLRKQTKGAVYPAPRAILSAAVEGAQVDFDTASRIESRYLTKPDRQPAVQEHDPGVLLRPAGDQLRVAAARRHRAVHGHQGRRPRRRDDGRRHRLLVRPRRHGGRAQGRRRSRTPRRARPTARSCSTRRSRAASPPRRRPTSCSAGSPRPPTRPTWPAATWSSRRSSRTRAQGAGVRRDRAVRQRRRAAVLQHLDAADHRAGDRRRPAGGLHRAALLQPGRQDAAGRDHPRQGDLRRRAGQGLRRGAADHEDADRGQRQPRLLHLAGDRHDGQRGPRDARRGRAPDVAGAGGDPGRLPGRHAAALRRAQHGADGEDPGRRRGRRRARRHRGARAPGQRRDRHDDRARPLLAAQGRRLLRLRRGRQARRASGPGWPSIPGRRASRSRSRT